jgi:hypothetical protein
MVEVVRTSELTLSTRRSWRQIDGRGGRTIGKLEGMGPVRVLGRIDQAQLAYDLLRSARVEARLSTSAPMAAIAETGRDDATLDLVVGESFGFSFDKVRHPNRPVVVLTNPAFFPEIEDLARTSAGPDAWAAWPATAEEIVAARQRAVERAGIRRPRWSRRQIILVAFLVLLALAPPIAWAFGPSSLTQGSHPSLLARMLRPAWRPSTGRKPSSSGGAAARGLSTRSLSGSFSSSQASASSRRCAERRCSSSGPAQGGSFAARLTEPARTD